MKRILIVVAAACLVAGACGSSSKSTRPVTVFAAASLTEAFNAAKGELGTQAKLAPTYNFAGSQVLVQQITEGSPADVFAAADEKNMQKLVDANLVETPKVFARNTLEIAVPPGNPKNIGSLADLEKPGVVLVLADTSVPAGNYARQAFQKAGLPAPRPKSLELDVKSVLAKLTAGDADAGIVYSTDVKAASDNVQGVPIPEAQNVIATYPVAVVKATKHRSAAVAFVDAVVAGAGQVVLRARGFLPPT